MAEQDDVIEIPQDEEPTKASPTGIEVSVITVERGRARFYVIGTSPYVHNRLSEKAKHELLMPLGRKSAAIRAANLKHIPIEEYQASPYRIADASAPTFVGLRSAAFRKAMSTAALDLPGASKSQVGRLTYVEGDLVGIYGIPQIYCAIVRSADMRRTPDVRTRAIMPEWAATFSVTFARPMMTVQAVTNLLVGAGITAGVGDGRIEKGALNYGGFEVVAENDPRYLEIVARGGRAAQMKALEKPEPYDEETAELLRWFDVELTKRTTQGAEGAQVKAKKRGAA